MRPPFAVSLLRRPAGILVAMFTLSCVSDASGPQLARLGAFSLAPSFESQAAAGIVTIDRIRVTGNRPGEAALVLDTTVAIAPGDTSVDLDLEVTVFGNNDTILVNVALITPPPDNDTAYKAGPIVTVPTVFGAPVPVPAVFTYTGPGANAAQVVALDSMEMVEFGDSVLLRAVALDAAGDTIPNVPQGWTSLDPAKILIRDLNQGWAIAQLERGQARVRVELPTGHADTAVVVVKPVPNAIAIQSGDGQTGTAGQQLPQPLVVEVTAADQLGVEDVSVDFAVASGGGSVSSPNELTDATGRAQVLFTLGPAVGTQQVTATTSVGTVTFTANSNAGMVAQFDVEAGQNQTASVGNPVPIAPSVRVRDGLGNPVPGVSVVFQVVQGGGSVTAPNPVTASDGIAAVGSWTLGATPGLNLLDALVVRNLMMSPEREGDSTVVAQGGGPSIDTLFVTFSATATVTGPATLTLVSGDGQSETVGTALPDSFVVAVADSLSNPIAGVSVDWAVTAGNGTLGSASTLTDATGEAWVFYTLDTGARSDTIQASVTGLPSVDFEATGTPAAASQLAVTTQPGGQTAGTPFALDVAVQDQFGNTITSDNTTDVSLAIVAGTGTAGATLSGTIPVTAAAGVASFTDLAVDSAGTGYRLEATDTGLAPDTTNAFDVAAGAPAQLAFVDQPTNALAGATIAPAVTVAILDAIGNTVATAADTVDIAIDNNPAGGTLSGTTSVEAAGGIATFSDLSIDNAGTGYTLQASASGLTADVSAAFDIQLAATSTWTGAVSSDWTEPGNWNPGVPSSTDDVTIPAGTPNDPALSSNVTVVDLTVASGATLETNGFIITATGSVDAGTTITGSGEVVLVGNGVTLQGTVPNLTLLGGTVTLQGLTTVTGFLNLFGPSTLDVNGQTLHVSDQVFVRNQSRIVMDDPADLLVARSFVTFDGASTLNPTPTMSAGRMEVGLGFTQTPNNSIESFVSTGTQVVLNGSAGQAIQFFSPGPAASRFDDLVIDNSAGGVNFVTDVHVDGDVTILQPTTITEVAGSHTVTVLGDFTAPTGNAIILGGLTFGGTVAIGGTYLVGTTTFIGTGQTVPALTYQNLAIEADVTLGTAISAFGALVSSAGTTPTITGGGNTLGVDGLNVDGLVLDDVALTSSAGTITAFDNVTFQGYAPTDVQFTIDHPGASTPFTFDNLSFLVTPTAPGLYIDASDSDGRTPDVFRIDLTNSNPTDGSAFTQTDGVAQVNWPGAPQVKTWTGAVSSDWSTAGNWSPTGAPSSADDVTIPAGTPNAPVVSTSVTVNDLTVASGATLETSGFTVAASGNVDGGTTITGTGLVLLVGQGTTVQGVFPNLSLDAADVTLSGPTTVNGNLGIGGPFATLTVGGQTLAITGDLTLNTSTQLAMTDPADLVTVGGNASFDGRSTLSPSPALSAGTLELQGDFTQLNNSSDESFASTGTEVVLTGSGQQVLDFASPGPAGSRFFHLSIDNAGGAQLGSDMQVDGDLAIQTPVQLTDVPVQRTLTVLGDFTSVASSDVTVDEVLVAGLLNLNGSFSVTLTSFIGSGQTVPDLPYQDLGIEGDVVLTTAITANNELVSSSASTPTVTGGGNALNVSGFNVDGLVLNDVALTSTNGPLTAFDNVTFQGYAATDVQLTISHSGAGSPFTFDNLTFDVIPPVPPGYYISATDGDGLAPFLTIDLTNSTPTDGSQQTLESGGAVVNWPVSPPTTRTWIGEVSTDWFTDINWIPSGVPGPADDILVSSSATNTLVLTAGVTVNDLTVEPGATLNTNGFDITATGDVDGGTTITGTGTVVLTGAGVTLQGTLPNVTVNGTVSMTGPATINGDFVVNAGNLDVLGQVATVTGNMTVSGTGTLTMVDATGQVSVAGSFTASSSVSNLSLTDGLLEVGGNFTQVAGSSINFGANTAHTVILNGTTLQTVTFTSGGLGTSRFYNLEIANTGAGVDFASDAAANGTVTMTSGNATGVGSTMFIGDALVDASGTAWQVENTTFTGGTPTLPATLTTNLSFTSNPAALQTSFAVTGNLTVISGNLDINGQTVSVSGNMSVTGGVFTMNAGDLLSVGGSFSVTSNSSNSGLTGGVLEVGGDFTQSGSTTSFSASSAHRARFNGTGVQTLSFANPGPTLSHFANLEIVNTAGSIDLATDVAATGQLIVQAATPPLITGNGNGLGAGGMNVDGLVVDDVQLASIDGTITQFDNVTFQGYTASDIQFAIFHPGAASPFTFDGLTFDVVPPAPPGYYISATDSDGASPNVFTIDLTNSAPSNGSNETLTDLIAVVNWPGAVPVKTWIAAVNDLWSEPVNWNPVGVPTSTDDVSIPAGPPGPVLSAPAVAGDLTVASGATINTNGFTLTATGNVDAGTTITGTGTLVLTGTGVTLQGAVPNLDVNGTVTLSGGVTAQGDVTVSGGGNSLDLGGQTMDVTGNFTTTASGTVTLTDPSDLLTVAGNALFGGGGTNGLLTDGVIEVFGDFTQLNTSSPAAFASTGTAVLLNGVAQTMLLQGATSFLDDLESANTSDGVQLNSNLTVNGDFTLSTGAPFAEIAARTVTVLGDVSTVAGSRVTLENLFVGGALSALGTYEVATTTFTGSASQVIPAGLPYVNVVVVGQGAFGAGTPVLTGDLTVVGGVSFPLAGTTTVAGDVTVSGGGTVLDLNGQTMNVAGDFSTTASGTVTLTTSDDVLDVGYTSAIGAGNALFAGGSTNGLLTDGRIEVFGDFTQLNSSSPASFASTGTAVLLDGVAQTVLMQGATSFFDDLTSANTSDGVQVNSNVRVEGDLTVSTAAPWSQIGSRTVTVIGDVSSVPGSSITLTSLMVDGALNANGSYAVTTTTFTGPSTQVIPAGLTYTNVSVTGQGTLGAGTPVLTGDLTVSGGVPFPLLGTTTVGGNVTASVAGTVLDLNGQTLDVTGDFSIGVSGLLQMTTGPGDQLLVGGDASFAGASTVVPAPTLTTGTIQVAGSFTQLNSTSSAAFASNGTAVTLNGTAVQVVTFQGGASSFFQDLEVANTVGGAQMSSSFRVAGSLTLTGAASLVDGATNQLTVDGDVTAPAAGSDLTLNSLTVSGAVSVAGTYAVTTTTFAGPAGQVIPAALPYTNVTVSGEAAFGPGSPAVGGNLLVSGGVPFVLDGTTTVGGDVTALNAGTVLNLGNQTLNVSGDFSIGVGGLLNMTNPADQLLIGGNAEFQGASTVTPAPTLTLGTIEIGGSFSQLNSTSTEAFASSGTAVVFNGGGAQAITVQGAGSFFADLEFANTVGGIVLNDPVTATGQLISGATVTPTVSGFGRALDVGGLAVDGLVLDNVLLSSTGGTITGFDNVTFQNYAATATQFAIDHPGTSPPPSFTFDGLSFLTTPTSGFYIDAADSDGLAPDQLVIDLTNSNPNDGSARTQTDGVAVVTWPGAVPLRSWNGTTSSDWSTPTNWTPAVVPTATDDVTILSGTPNTATLSQSVSVNDLVVDPGATLDVATFTLTANGSVIAGTTITGTGTVAMTGSGVTLEGTLPSVDVFGDVVLSAHATVNGDLFISGVGAVLDLGDQTMDVTGDLTTDGSGILSLTDTDNVLTVSGDALFAGGNTDGDLTDGRIELAGNFTQTNATTTVAFASTGTVVELNGTGLQSVSFAGPGISSSRFQDLEIANTGAGVELTSVTQVMGDLTYTQATSLADQGTQTLTVNGDVTTITGAALALNALVVQGALNIDPSSLYGVGTTTVTGGPAQVLPAGVPYFNLTVNGQGSFGPGTPVIGGDLEIGNAATFPLAGLTTVNGNVLVRFLNTNLDLNGQTMQVGGNFTTSAGGFVTMASPNDVLDIDGDALFAGGSTASSLSDGQILVAGGFQQTNGPNTDTFAPTGTRVVLDGAGPGAQTINFAAPGASFFQDLEIAQTAGGVTLATAVVANGQLISPLTVTPTVTGSGNALNVAGLDVDGLVLDNVLLNSTDGNLVDFDNVTFQNYSSTDVQFTISHPGAAFGFDGLSFLVTPTMGGAYIDAVDSDAVTPFFTIDLTNSLPTDGSGETTTSGGAVVNWPGGVPLTQWTGSLSSEWSLDGNWAPQTAPPPGTNVVIPVGTPNSPVLSQNVTVNDLTVVSGTTLDVATFTLTATGDVSAGTTIVGSGTVELTGSGVTLQGDLPNVLVSGTVTLAAETNASQVTVSGAGANLTLAGQELDITGDLIVENDALFTMTDPNDLAIVLGNVTFDGASTATPTPTLTDGLIRVAGDFTQLNTTSSEAFQSQGTAVVLDGTAQQTVTFNGPLFSSFPWSDSYFQQLDIDNTSGSVQIANWAHVIGDLDVSTPVSITSIGNSELAVTGDLTTPIGSDLAVFTHSITGLGALNVGGDYNASRTWFWDAGPGQIIPATLPYNELRRRNGQAIFEPGAPDVGGLLRISGAAPFPLAGLTTAGTVDVGNGAVLDLAGQTLNVTGNFAVLSDALLSMTDPSDLLIVGGNATFDGASTAATLTNGLIQVAGDFTQLNSTSDEAFQSQGTVVELNGSAQQIVTFTGPFDNAAVPFTGSFFQQLNVTNTSGGVLFPGAWGYVAGNLTVANNVPVAVDGFQGLVVEGNLSTPGDLTSANPLYVFGALSVGGTYSVALTRFEGGSGQAIPAGLAYSGVAVSDSYAPGLANFGAGTPSIQLGLTISGAGTFALPGATTVGADLTVEQGAQLDLAGQTLDVTGDLLVDTDALLSMTDPGDLDLLVVGGSATFDGASTATPALTLTNGLIQVAGDFTQLNTTSDEAFQSQGTVVELNGTALQTVTFTGPFDFDVLPGTGSYFQQLDITNTSGGVSFADWGNVTGNLTVGPTPVPLSVTGRLGVQGDLSTPGDVSVGNGLRLVAGLSVGGTYAALQTRFVGGSGQVIPVGLNYSYNVVRVLDLAAPGLANFGPGAPVIGGQLQLWGSGTFALAGPTTVASSVWLRFGAPSLVVAGQTLDVGSVLILEDDALLVMTDPADQIRVAGDVVFDGASTLTPTPTLTAGVIEAAADFRQRNTISDESFASTGTRVILNGSGAQNIRFDTPGSSSFHDLDLANSAGGVTLSSAIQANGQLVSLSTTPTVSGGGNPLTVAGLAVNGLVLDNTPLTSAGGTINGFDNVTFQGFAPTDVQLTIDHPGAPVPFTFDGLNFAVAPQSPGLYIDASDSDGAVPDVFEIDLTNSNPTDGAAFTQTDLVAVVNWPGGVPLRTWNGSTSTDWSLAANWTPAIVPINGDNVFIPASTPNDPTLSDDVTVTDVVLDPGANLDLFDFTLTALGNVDAGTTIGGSPLSALVMAGSGVTLQGTVPNLTVTGDVTLVGQTFAGNATVSGPSALLDLGGQELFLGGDLFVQADAVLQMLDLNDHLVIGGNATFDGASTLSPTETLKAGLIEFGGTFFTQGSGSSTESFASTGTLVVFNGLAAQTVDFATPGAAGSGFFDVIVDNTGGLQLASDVHVNNSFDVQASVPIFEGPSQNLTVLGDVSTTASSSMGITGLLVGGTLSIGGTYGVTNTTFTGGNLQVIPATLPYDNLFVTGQATFGPGAPTVFTDLVVSGGGSFPLQGTTTVDGNATFSGAGTDLILNGQILDVQFGFTVDTDALITMTDPSDFLAVGGTATFDGASTNTFLEQGLIQVGGSFVQIASTSTSSFASTGTGVLLGGTGGGQLISFQTPGANFSRFQDLEIDNPDGAAIPTLIHVTGTLSVTDGDLSGSSARVPGDIFVDGLGSVSAAGIFIGGSLSGPGLPGFSPTTTSFIGTAQVIPATPAYQTVIVGEATTAAQASFGGDAVIAGDLIVSGPVGTQLSLGSNAVTVTGNFSTAFGAVLLMQSQTGVLSVDGDVLFGGSSTAGLLTTGFLEVGGDFVQAGPATGSFLTSGNHTVVLTGASGGVQNVSFFSPTTSHFQNLDVTGAVNGVRIGSNVEVGGIFTSVPGAGANTILDATGGGGFTFQVGEVDVDGLTLDNRVLFRFWTTSAGASARFDNVTFASYDVDDLQFWVRHPGVPFSGILDFKEIRFSTFLSGANNGLYIRVEDDGTGDQLTVNLNRATSPSPEPPTTANGDAFTDLVNGAEAVWF